MSALTQVVKGTAPKLVPFFKAIAIYFVVFPSTSVPTILSAILKCYPILSLMLFVVLHGVSFGDEYKYARQILIGLIFCCIGDWCLIWPNYFELGMLAFAIGHIKYILAFGFQPLNPKLAVILYGLSVIGLGYLMPGLEGILLPGVVIYTLILTTMAWRAIARAQETLTWSTICASLGAVLFLLSDLLLGVDRFRSPIDNSQFWVMTTYYAAQFGITLSIIDANTKVPQQFSQ